MSNVEELEKRIQKNSLAIKELSIQIEALDRQAESLFADLEVSPDQVSKFVETKEHFTEKNWKTLREHQQTLEEKLTRDLANVTNPLKTKKHQKELNVAPFWLFVK